MSTDDLIYWPEFKIFIRDNVPPPLYEKIIKKLERSMEGLSNKDQFKEHFENCKTSIQKEPKKNFVFIKKLKDTIKLHRVKKRDRNNSLLKSRPMVHSHKYSDKPGPSRLHINEQQSIAIESSDDATSDKDSKDKACDSISNNSHQNASSSHLELLSPESRKRQLKLRKFEKILENCKSRIRQLEETELVLDALDDEYSDYIKLHRYKNFAIKIWKQIRKLENQSNHSGRLTRKKFRFCGSKYNQLNDDITSLVNARGEIKFPNFRDVFKCVKNFSNQEDSKWTPKHIHDVSVDIFRKLIDRLQQIRRQDFQRDFGCHLTDIPYEDPYDIDQSVRQKLNRNREEGIKRLDDVLEKFATMKESDVSVGSDSENNEGSIDESDSSDSDASLEKITPGDAPVSDSTLINKKLDIDLDSKPNLSSMKSKSIEREKASCSDVAGNSDYLKRQLDQPISSLGGAKTKCRRIEFSTIEQNETSDKIKLTPPISINGTLHSESNGQTEVSPSSPSSQLMIDLEAPVKAESNSHPPVNLSSNAIKGPKKSGSRKNPIRID